MTETKGEQTVSRERQVELQREEWWAALPINVLSDWAVNLLGELLFRSGKQPLEKPVMTSVISLRKRIGSHRQGGVVPAKRQRITEASTECEQLGLLRREECKKLWWLLSPPSTDGQRPAWEGFYPFNASLFRRKEVPGGSRVRAAAARLSFALDGSGTWSGDEEDLARAFAVKSRLTAQKRLSEIEAAAVGLAVERQWGAEGLVITVRGKIKERPKPLTADELRAELRSTRDQLWYPQLIDQAVKRAAAASSSGKLTLQRMLTGFYQPALQLQEEVQGKASPFVVKYGLEQALQYGILDQPNTKNWHGYVRKVIKNNKDSQRFRQGARPKTKKAEEKSTQDWAKEVRQLLEQAAMLNGQGKGQEARELLPGILEHATKVAPLFQGDLGECEDQMRLAFKQGTSDFQSVVPRPYSRIDFLPEWSPGS